MAFDCALTFDVENWFQVENLRAVIDKSNWNDFESTVEKNTNNILEILDSYQVKATFFVLGSVADKHPVLIKNIIAEGHEIASHGYGHDLTYNLSDAKLQEDITRSKDALEQIGGEKIFGYRAPNFSISDHLVDVLIGSEFLYDSMRPVTPTTVCPGASAKVV